MIKYLIFVAKDNYAKLKKIIYLIKIKIWYSIYPKIPYTLFAHF